MTDITTQHAATDHGIRARIDAFFASLGMGFNAYLERAGRIDEVRSLQAKSDAELKELGIERDRIVHHVFSDLMGI